MVRGIERGKVFQSDADRNHFLERLGEILKDTQTLCYAWALIPNHFHLSGKSCLDGLSSDLPPLTTWMHL
jgi:putative transposase